VNHLIKRRRRHRPPIVLHLHTASLAVEGCSPYSLKLKQVETSFYTGGAAFSDHCQRTQTGAASPGHACIIWLLCSGQNESGTHVPTTSPNEQTTVNMAHGTPHRRPALTLLRGETRRCPGGMFATRRWSPHLVPNKTRRQHHHHHHHRHPNKSLFLSSPLRTVAWQQQHPLHHQQAAAHTHREEQKGEWRLARAAAATGRRASTCCC
jgi:hypothetical protein